MKPCCAAPRPPRTPWLLKPPSRGLTHSCSPTWGWGNSLGAGSTHKMPGCCCRPVVLGHKAGYDPPLPASPRNPKFHSQQCSWPCNTHCWHSPGTHFQLLYLMGHFEGTMSPAAELGRTMGTGRRAARRPGCGTPGAPARRKSFYFSLVN